MSLRRPRARETRSGGLSAVHHEQGHTIPILGASVDFELSQSYARDLLRQGLIQTWELDELPGQERCNRFFE